MSAEEYDEAIAHYAATFRLQQKWIVEVVEKLPEVKTNYSDSKEVLAFTDWITHHVVFKDSLMHKPKWIARAYIRHELRHCQQRELFHLKMKEKYGEMAGIYTQLLIAADNIKGYGRSIMEQDAWLVSCGIYLDINKIVKRILKRGMSFIAA